MCAFQTELSILKDYDTDFFQARSSEKRTLIKRKISLFHCISVRVVLYQIIKKRTLIMRTY